MFFLGCISYFINNCGNGLVLFRVNFVSGDWSSFIGGIPFLVLFFIYHLLSIWIFQYTLLSITSESRPFLSPIAPGGIAGINPIFTLIYIYFDLSPAASVTTPNEASSDFKSAASAPSSSYPRLVDLPSLTILYEYFWVAGKRRDMTFDRYVVAVLNLVLLIYLHKLTSVFKSLFGQLMLSESCLTLSY